MGRSLPSPASPVHHTEHSRFAGTLSGLSTGRFACVVTKTSFFALLWVTVYRFPHVEFGGDVLRVVLTRW